MNILVRASQEYRSYSDWSLFDRILKEEFRKILMFPEYTLNFVGFIFEARGHTFAIKSLKHIEST